MSAKSKKKILIVDDESPVAEMISEFCKCFGFDTRVLTRGDDALQVAKEWHPNLITTDLVMPGCSGLQVIEMLKADSETKDIPVIVISSLDRSQGEPEILKQCQVVMLKPVKMKSLGEKISSTLNS